MTDVDDTAMEDVEEEERPSETKVQARAQATQISILRKINPQADLSSMFENDDDNKGDDNAGSDAEGEGDSDDDEKTKAAAEEVVGTPQKAAGSKCGLARV